MEEPDEKEQAEEKPAVSEPRVYQINGWEVTVTDLNERPSNAELVRRAWDVLEQQAEENEKHPSSRPPRERLTGKARHP